MSLYPPESQSFEARNRAYTIAELLLKDVLGTGPREGTWWVDNGIAPIPFDNEAEARYFAWRIGTKVEFVRAR